MSLPEEVLLLLLLVGLLVSLGVVCLLEDPQETNFLFCKFKFEFMMLKFWLDTVSWEKFKSI